MTKDDIINKLQDQGLRWIESQREEATLNEMEKVENDGRRKQLTDEEIHDCFQQKGKTKVETRRRIVRAIERAHGIKDL